MTLTSSDLSKVIFEPIKVLERKTILDYFNKHVSGQEKAKKILATLGYLFNNRCLALEAGVRPQSLPKLNVFVTGPTGMGKTFTLKTLAASLDLPFMRVDCSSITQSGWSGMSISDCLNDHLITGNTLKHRAGVIMLDEFDKLGSGPAASNGSSPHINIQQNLLDLLDSEFAISDGSSKSAAMQSKMNDYINNSLIVCSGSFENVRQAKSAQKATIGFMDDQNKEDIDCWKEEMMKAGLIPEVVGRIVHIIELEKLTTEQVRDVFHKDSSVYTKYKNLLPGFKISSEDLDRMSEEITGSRYGLRELETSVFEEVLKALKVYDNEKV